MFKHNSSSRHKSSRASYRVQHNHPGWRPTARCISSVTAVRLLLPTPAVYNLRLGSHPELCRFANRWAVQSFPHLDATDPQLADDCRPVANRRNGQVEGAAVRYSQQADLDECGCAGRYLSGHTAADSDTVRQGETRGPNSTVAGSASVPL